MSTRRALIFMVLTALFLALFSSCAETPSTPDPTTLPSETPRFTVYLDRADEYFEVVGDDPQTVEAGGEAHFTLKMKGRWCVESALWQNKELDAQIVNEYDGTTTVTIPNVRYSMILSLSCATASAYITYHSNDGEDRSFTVGHTLQSRLRPNTENGARFSRAGYVQTGWNTEPDGSGTHAGLGSRVTPVKGGTLDLYAEWAKESPAEDFTFRKYGKGYTLTGYIGTDSTVVLPGKYNGSVVDIIAPNAFKNTAAKCVILPSSIEVIAPDAFSGSALRELYIFDNVKAISDACFTDCPDFSTLHISALLAPRHGQDLYSEYNFCDKYDLLILNENKKKLIVFGGSGAYMSFEALQAEEELRAAGIDYICINMAVNGWFNGQAQFDMITHYMKEGDVFLHLPETSSGFSLLYDTTMTPRIKGFEYNRLRMYYCLESNYDLISLIDLRGVTEFFDGFQSFNEERQELPETSYTDYKTSISWYGTIIRNDFAYINARGSIAVDRPANLGIGAGEADIVVEYITDQTAAARLARAYDALSARGVKVFFSTAPINADTLEKRLRDPASFDRESEDGSLYYGRPDGIGYPVYESLESWIQTFEQTVKETLHATVLLPLHETIYHSGDYFEPDYHLCAQKASEYTRKFTDALRALLAEERL